MDLAQKLQFKPGMRVKLIGAPKGLKDAMGALPEGTKLVTRGKPLFEGVLVFCRDAANVENLALPAVRETLEDGLVWLCYPKGSSGIKTDISRDKGWKPVATLGMRPVRAVAIDETWSALTWRPQTSVKRKVKSRT